MRALVLMFLLGGCACMTAAPMYAPLAPAKPDSGRMTTTPGTPPATPPSEPPATPPSTPPSEPPTSGKNNRGHGNGDENVDPALNGLGGINWDADNPGKKK